MTYDGLQSHGYERRRINHGAGVYVMETFTPKQSMDSGVL